jgi:hypothetical protein
LSPTEQFFTVPEIAKQLRLDRHTVTSLFERERGVVVVGNPETTRGHRRYRTLRVPASVLNRVISRMSVR